MSVWERKCINTFSDLPELRRQAFVDCILRKSEHDDVIGIFGENINEPLLYAYGLYPVPIQGLDRYVFKYGNYENCDLIKSTIIYLRTEKCPLLFSPKMFVVDRFCDRFNNALIEQSEKKVHIYSNDDLLRNELELFYNREYSEAEHNKAIDMYKKNDELYCLLSSSDLTGKELFEIMFFSRYIINLEERVEFLSEAVERTSFNNLGEREKIPVACAGGIYSAIECYLFNTRYEFVLSNIDAKFACKGCCLTTAKKLDYLGG